MRHRKSGKKLGRTWEHRKAMFKNMARSLVVHERITTTQTKARELSKIADKLITLALKDDVSARRQAYKMLGNHSLVQKLFNEIGPRFNSGRGGYTRVVKFATPRAGDAAPMAVIEFAFPETESGSTAKPEPAGKTVASEEASASAQPQTAVTDASAASKHTDSEDESAASKHTDSENELQVSAPEQEENSFEVKHESVQSPEQEQPDSDAPEEKNR